MSPSSTHAVKPYTAAMTIAGSDPSGGAGIQADLKTFHQFGVYGMAAVTLITVQNTRTVERVQILDAMLVEEQILCAGQDILPAAIKTGALGNAAIIESVTRALKSLKVPIVVDPVMISKHGSPLLDEEAAAVMKELLFPVSLMITPNLEEASSLTGIPYEDESSILRMGRCLLETGAAYVLIKGGHAAGENCRDYLFDEKGYREWVTPRVDTLNTHGTGCTLSAAITALLARGNSPDQAVGKAKAYIAEAIATHPGLGHGCGPINHFADAETAPELKDVRHRTDVNL